MKKSILLILTLLIFSRFASAIPTFTMNSNCKNAYLAIMDMRFSQGQQLLNNEKKNNPNNLIVYYLENYIDLIKLNIEGVPQDYKSMSSNKAVRLSQIAKGDKKSPYYLYAQAEIQLQWAFIHIKFQENIAAAREINEANSLLSKNQKLFPNFLLNKKGLGVLHAIVGAIPDKYKWLANFVGFEGTVKQGISEISELFLKSISDPTYAIYKTESIFYLTFLTINLNNDEVELDKLEKWHQMVDTLKSPLFTYARVSLMKKRGENDKIIKRIESMSKDASRYPLNYLIFLLGEAKLNKLDITASKCFDEFIKNSKSQNYIKAAWLRLGWIHLINGKSNLYKEALENIKKKGVTITEDDKYAESEAKKGAVPNIVLLKSRLLFDGGYYNKSLSILLEKKPSQIFNTTKEIYEYYYRIARDYHGMKNYAEAIKFYELTFSKNSEITDYFMPNAALQIGLIYEKQGNKEKAKQYFNKCLNMPDCDYKSGIDIKAKAGLERVKH